MVWIWLKKHLGKDGFIKPHDFVDDIDVVAQQAVQAQLTSTTVVPVKSTATAIIASTNFQAASVQAMTVAAGEVAASSLASGTAAVVASTSVRLSM